MKKVLCLLFVFALLLGLASCAKAPTEPPTTAAQEVTVVNPLGETVINKDKSIDYNETESNVEFVLSSYYTSARNYASLSNIHFNPDDFTVNATAYVDMKMIKIGSRADGMVIEYKAYNAAGEVVRNSYIKADLKGIHSGKTVKDVKFNFPYDTVKVEFYDYVED